jgi:hypothetical protein
LKGDTAGAFTEYEKPLSLDDDPQILGLLGRAYAGTGEKDKALELLRERAERPKHEFVRRYIVALDLEIICAKCIYIRLGEHGRAIDSLHVNTSNRQHRHGLDPS